MVDCFIASDRALGILLFWRVKTFVIMPVGAGKDFIEFVKSLPPSALEQLYAQSTTCIAVYRYLGLLDAY